MVIRGGILVRRVVKFAPTVRKAWIRRSNQLIFHRVLYFDEAERKRDPEAQMGAVALNNISSLETPVWGTPFNRYASFYIDVDN